MQARTAGLIGGLLAWTLACAVNAQIVLFNSFGVSDSFSTTSPLVVGRPSTRTTVVAARFQTTANGTINSVRLALGPSTPALGAVTIDVRIFGQSPVDGLPTIVMDTMEPQTVNLATSQILTFSSTRFLDTFTGTVLWLVVSIEEPVGAGETVRWNKSPSATGNVALSTDGEAFVSQGTVTLPAFQVIGEVLNGACCNTATGQCIVTAHIVCTQWAGFTYSPGHGCSPTICAVSGACCTGVSCSVTTAGACGAGQFLGPATTCQLPSGANPCCRADINGVGGVSVQDLFDFLALWFAGCP